MDVIKPRETLDRQLNKLIEDILILGSMVEQATLKAVEALKNRDVDTARRIYAGDERINLKRFQIESDCLTLIATQQPIARDLRILASSLEVNTELERMGDYAKGIARIAMEMGNHPPFPYLPEISEMASLANDMLHRSLSAFFQVDEGLAREIPNDDDEVDALYNKVNQALIGIVGENPASMDLANYMMWAAHNLERMADRVTNICERTIFVATGQLLELDVSDDEIRGKG
jgi:phosphate transport system protein